MNHNVAQNGTTSPKPHKAHDGRKPFASRVFEVYAKRGTSPTCVLGTVADRLHMLATALENSETIAEQDIAQLLECEDLVSVVRDEMAREPKQTIATVRIENARAILDDARRHVVELVALHHRIDGMRIDDEIVPSEQVLAEFTRQASLALGAIEVAGDELEGDTGPTTRGPYRCRRSRDGRLTAIAETLADAAEE